MISVTLLGIKWLIIPCKSEFHIITPLLFTEPCSGSPDPILLHSCFMCSVFLNGPWCGTSAAHWDAEAVGFFLLNADQCYEGLWLSGWHLNRIHVDWDQCQKEAKSNPALSNEILINAYITASCRCGLCIMTHLCMSYLILKYLFTSIDLTNLLEFVLWASWQQCHFNYLYWKKKSNVIFTGDAVGGDS